MNISKVDNVYKKKILETIDFGAESNAFYHRANTGLQALPLG